MSHETFQDYYLFHYFWFSFQNHGFFFCMVSQLLWLSLPLSSALWGSHSNYRVPVELFYKSRPLSTTGFVSRYGDLPMGYPTRWLLGFWAFSSLLKKHLTCRMSELMNKKWLGFFFIQEPFIFIHIGSVLPLFPSLLRWAMRSQRGNGIMGMGVQCLL